MSLPTQGNDIDRSRVSHLANQLPDSAARDELVALMQPLVRALAARFAGRSEPFDDLVQVASVGLLKAIDNYDTERGKSILAYGTVMIVGELRHHFRDAVTPLRIPRRLLEARRSVDRAVEELTQRHGRSPRVSEIAAATGLDEETVLEAVATIEASFPIPIDDLGSNINDNAVTVVGEYSRLDDLDSVSVQLVGFPERERKILFLRFFRGLSQAEVAREIGISQVQVSRILSSSLQRIREGIDVG